MNTKYNNIEDYLMELSLHASDLAVRESADTLSVIASIVAEATDNNARATLNAIKTHLDKLEDTLSYQPIDTAEGVKLTRRAKA